MKKIIHNDSLDYKSDVTDGSFNLLERDEWMKIGHEIVKYSPQWYRNGVFIRKDWTSSKKIGKSFHGVVLKRDDYLVVEDRYSKTAIELFNLSGCKDMILYERAPIYHSFYLNSSNTLFWKDNQNLLEAVARYSIGDRVKANDIEPFIKLGLREGLWFQLVNEEFRFALEPGYDYYLHVHTTLSKELISKVARKHKLFCDPRSCVSGKTPDVIK